MSINDWIIDQERRGVATFSVQQIRGMFADHSEKAIKSELNRLVSAKVILSVYRGFYVIIPTQYQLKGIVPPTYYINELMSYLGKPYYVGLLSAAAVHGASHQRAMATQVITIGPRSRISKKNSLLDWNYRQEIPGDLLESRNGEMSSIKYSSAELTVVDLIQFASSIGGYQRAATVIAELTDMLDISKMKAVIPYTTISTMQRFGYMLEFILNERGKADELYSVLKEGNGYFNAVLMSTEHPKVNDSESNRWRVNMNIDIEIDDL